MNVATTGLQRLRRQATLRAFADEIDDLLEVMDDHRVLNEAAWKKSPHIQRESDDALLKWRTFEP